MTKIDFEKLGNPAIYSLPNIVQKNIESYKKIKENYKDESGGSGQTAVTTVIGIIIFFLVIYMAHRRYVINNWEVGSLSFWGGWIVLGAVFFTPFAFLLLIAIFITQGYTFYGAYTPQPQSYRRVGGR